eukprot:4203988-Pleurochrysis_carterae.AAC.1
MQPLLSPRRGAYHAPRGLFRPESLMAACGHARLAGLMAEFELRADKEMVGGSERRCGCGMSDSDIARVVAEARCCGDVQTAWPGL